MLRHRRVDSSTLILMMRIGRMGKSGLLSPFFPPSFLLFVVRYCFWKEKYAIARLKSETRQFIYFVLDVQQESIHTFKYLSIDK